jgi:8-oxo-dGTP diphosphatase
VIDEGESLLEGLTREVEEETGLRVLCWRGPIYEVSAEAPDMGWRLRVEVHEAVEYEGELRIDDPDGIVVDAKFVPLDACADNLRGCPAWVREPLAEWAAERWTGEPRPFGFHVAGADQASLVVTRT